MRIVLREHDVEVITALPFWRRQLVPGSRNKVICRHYCGRAHQIWNVTGAVRKNLAFDAHDDFRAMMSAKYLRIVVDRCLAPDPCAERLSVETHKEQADVRVPMNIAEGAVHVVTVVLRVLPRVGPGELDEAEIARPNGTIDVVLIARRDKKEACLSDELAVLLPELEVEAMLLEAVGNTAPVESVLQFTHSVMVE